MLCYWVVCMDGREAQGISQIEGKIPEDVWFDQSIVFLQWSCPKPDKVSHGLTWNIYVS